MTDNDVWRVLMVLLSEPLKVQTGIANLAVMQLPQATQQGMPTPPFVGISRVHSHRYGSPKRSSVYNGVSGAFDTVHSQIVENTYQVQTFATLDPGNSSLPTAYDVAAITANYLQTDLIREELKLSGIGIYRITDIRVPSFVDDRQRYELAPNFDFTLNYVETITTVVPVVDATELDINRV